MKKRMLFSGIATVLVAAIMFFKPAYYEAETTFFVPLTLLEKQINQNGIGFGSPVEVDAHLELINSRTISQLVEMKFGEGTEFDVSRTRNGAVLVTVRSNNPNVAADAANAIVQLTDSVKQDMLRQNVGQSLDFVDSRLSKLSKETDSFRKILDSLRFEAQSDSLALAALLFQKERQYGSAVVELTDMQRKQETLKGYLNAPAPDSYIISGAEVPTRPAGLPWWAAGILAGFIGAASLWAVEWLRK